MFKYLKLDIELSIFSTTQPIFNRFDNENKFSEKILCCVDADVERTHVSGGVGCRLAGVDDVFIFRFIFALNTTNYFRFDKKYGTGLT